jgi:hypothetical protein
LIFQSLLAVVQTQDEAVDILDRASKIGKETVAAWQQNWDLVINSQTSGVWSASVFIGTVLGAGSLVYLGLKEGPEIMRKQLWDKLGDMILIPLVLIILLSNNGAVPASLVRGTHLIGMYLIGYTQSAQLASSSLDAVLKSTLTNKAVAAEISREVAACNTLQPSERTACLQQVGERAKDLIDSGQAFGGGDLADFDVFLNPFNILSTPLRIIEVFLTWWQWAWSNMLEASLLLSALFFPIALGLTMLPLGGGRVIFSWASGTLAAYGAYFAYVLLVGFIALVLNNQPGIMYQGGDIGLTTFLAIFAPGFSATMGVMGGNQLYAAFRTTQNRIIATVTGIGGLIVTSAGRAFGG